MVAHERVDIAVLFRLPLHELQRADRRRATVDIVAEKDEQIVRVVKRNLRPEPFEAVRLSVHIADRENPTKHPTSPPFLIPCLYYIVKRIKKIAHESTEGIH